MDARLYLVLDTEVGSILDDRYSVTQSTSWYYHYVKWWVSRTILQAWSEVKFTKVETPLVAPTVADSDLSNFPIFWVWWSDFHPSFDVLATIHCRVPKYRLCLDSSLLRFILMTSWAPIWLMLGSGYSDKLNRGYVSCQVWNIFLTPENNWTRDYIRD